MSRLSIFSTADSNPLLVVRRQVSLICFAFAGDLALDLFSELQGILDFLEHFGRATGAAHNYRSVSKDSSHGRLVDHDALDSGEEDFRGAAFHEAGLYDDPLVGDGHLRNATFQQADTKESCSDEETNKRPDVHGVTRGDSFSSCGLGKCRDEKSDCEQLKTAAMATCPSITIQCSLV